MSSSRSHRKLCTATPIWSLCSVFTFLFVLCLCQAPYFFKAKSHTGNHVISGMNWYMWYSPQKYFLKYLWKVRLSAVWAYDHWIPFRRYNWLTYQAMISTRSQSQLCTATPISSHCSVLMVHFGFFLRQAQHLLQAKSRTGNYVSSWINWYIWYSPLKHF